MCVCIYLFIYASIIYQLSHTNHLSILETRDPWMKQREKRQMFWVQALDRPNVAVAMTSRVLLNNPEIKQQNSELVFCYHITCWLFKRTWWAFGTQPAFLSHHWNDITHARLESSPTQHLMVIVSLPNPLAHNSLTLDAGASHENVFIKLWFLLPALIQDTVVVSRGYRSGCVSSPGPFSRQLVWSGFAVSLIAGRGGSHLSHRDPEALLTRVRSLFNVWRLQEHSWATLQFPVCALSVNVGDPFSSHSSSNYVSEFSTLGSCFSRNFRCFLLSMFPVVSCLLRTSYYELERRAESVRSWRTVGGDWGGWEGGVGWGMKGWGSSLQNADWFQPWVHS